MTDAAPDSPSSSELLVEGYAAFNRRDTDRLLELMVDDFQWNEADGVPGQKGCYSAREFAAYVEGFDRLWKEFTFEPVEQTAGADGAILAVVRGRGRGKASGEAFELLINHVWRFRDGQVARMDAYLDRAEADKAAGIA